MNETRMKMKSIQKRRSEEMIIEKIKDASFHIEAAMDALRREVQTGTYSAEGCKLIESTQDALKNLGMYYFKLPLPKKKKKEKTKT